MKDYLISLFIDDEMNMDNKIEFVKTIHADRAFKTETIQFLEQEKVLRHDMVTRMPEAILHREPKNKPRILSFFVPSLAGFAAAIVLVAAVLVFRSGPVPAPVPDKGTGAAADLARPHRFVIYRPEAARLKIMGTFTDWQPLVMDKLGTSGYWSLTLNLPLGEHRYAYLVENGRQVPDPTVLISETDDFGGENSIIRVGGPV